MLYTCLLWLSTSGLWTVQAKDAEDEISMRNHHRDLAPNNADFAFNLYEHLVASTPGKNVFISPVSISMSLAMLSLGAHGYTRAQILQGLGFNLTETSEAKIHHSFWYLHRLLTGSDSGLEITIGNALFLNKNLELLESFSADTKHYYEVDTLATDFQDWARASGQINEYIKNKTHGENMDLFSELHSPAMLILVNYIFFKVERDEVPSRLSAPLPAGAAGLLGNGTVFLILPDKGKIDTVINALSRDTMQRWADSLTNSLVDLNIPKISISGAYDLGDILEDMGTVGLYSKQADLSGITQEAQLKVSKVVHNAMLQLDEKGVKEAAPAAVPQNLASKPVVMHFNQPFIILIFDYFTWSSLFLVKVVNPT
uniref:Corticosteroid-binding globulin n=1 Tax=Molossus molossus TaxID=27622 RepID=A0A7J8K0H8_MOLMO|nr:serpin family A member 6 [Molossus molossus]